VHNRATDVFGTGVPLDDDAPLMDQGFDSLMAIDLQNALNQALNTSLTVSLLFNHPTIQKITDYLLAEALDFSDVGAEVAQTIETPDTAEDFSFLDNLNEDELAEYIINNL